LFIYSVYFLTWSVVLSTYMEKSFDMLLFMFIPIGLTMRPIILLFCF
jgi:hypothetical protein